MRFDDWSPADVIEGWVFDGALPAGLRGVVFGFDQGVDSLLPGAFGQGVVSGREKRLGHLQAQCGLKHIN